jgi:hypothetical protein
LSRATAASGCCQSARGSPLWTTGTRRCQGVPFGRLYGVPFCAPIDSQHIVQRAERMPCRQWFLVEYVKRGTGDRMRLQSRDQGSFVHDRTARRIDQSGRRLHDPKLGGADEAARAPAQNEVDRYDVGATEQFGLRHQRRACRGRNLGRHVLAPGNDLDSERVTDARNLGANSPPSPRHRGVCPRVVDRRSSANRRLGPHCSRGRCDAPQQE